MTRIKYIVNRILRRLNRVISNDNTIYLVYTMGKVGSTSIYNSLKKKKPYADVFHVHFLSKNWLESILPTMDEVFHYNIAHGKKLRRFLDAHSHRKIKIITLSREPVMREISNLFQNWKHLYHDIEEVDKQELKRYIESRDFSYSLDWFDTEFRDFTGVNLYDLPFDPDKGYEIYNFENRSILCLKLEFLNKISDKAFLEFLGNPLELEIANRSTDKSGNTRYEFLKENVSLADARLKEIYASKYMTHFYASEEISSFTKKWSVKNTVNDIS